MTPTPPPLTRTGLLDFLSNNTPYTDTQIITALKDCECPRIDVTPIGERWPQTVCATHAPR